MYPVSLSRKGNLKSLNARRAMRTTFPVMINIRTVLFGLVALLCTALNAQAQNILATAARNVKSYGAKGDGVSDDTQAFLDALNQGRDSHPPFLSAAAVYVPPGTYLIKKTLILWRQTLLFGEWTDPPTLVLAPDSPDFQDPSNPKPFLVTAGGYNVRAYSTDWKTRSDEYNGSTNNTFFIFLEDLKIKVGANNRGCDHAVYWACAQQTGIRNVAIDGGGATYALEAGLDGGGGIWEGLTVNNSVNGVVSSACSEMMVRNCTFNTPVTIRSYYLSSWIFLATTFNSPDRGVTLGGNPGVVTILDSEFRTHTPLITKEKKCVHLENVRCERGGRHAISRSTGLPRHWTSGRVIKNGITVANNDLPRDLPIPKPTYKSGVAYPRPSTICVNIKDLGAKGDGVSDDTAVILRALRDHSEIFFPLGTYQVTEPLTVSAGQKLFGQSVGSTIQLAADSAGFGAGEQTPFVFVNGRGKKGVEIVGLWFWNPADGGKCCLWNADSSSIVMDSEFISKSSTNSQPAWLFKSGGGFVENCWNPGGSAYGIMINSSDPLWLYSVQEEHYAGTALLIEHAANVVGLNMQFESSPTYVSIKNSKNIYLNGVLAGNWNFSSKQLVEVQNSKVSLFGLQTNCNRSGIVLEKTTTPFRRYGTSDKNGNFVTLSGFINQ
jgi:Pectate lyase superfamily protein